MKKYSRTGILFPYDFNKEHDILQQALTESKNILHSRKKMFHQYKNQ